MNPSELRWIDRLVLVRAMVENMMMLLMSIIYNPFIHSFIQLTTNQLGHVKCIHAVACMTCTHHIYIYNEQADDAIN